MCETLFFDSNLKAYRNKARDVHPDKNPSPEAAATFHKLKEAFDFLKEPQNRAKLDMHLDNWRKQQERYILH